MSAVAVGSTPLLVVAATELELAPLLPHLDEPRSLPSTWGTARGASLAGVPVVLVAHGVGKANAAAGVALALRDHAPLAVVQIGIGGGYLGSFLSVGMVAIASEDLHLDLGVRTPSGLEGLEELGLQLTPPTDGRPPRYGLVPTHAGLTAALAAVTEAPTLRFATMETVTGDIDRGAALCAAFEVSVESMEGAAAAQVCDRLGVPFAEVRGISNIVGERDRARWNVRSSSHAACDALRALCRRWEEVAGGVAPVRDRR